jgi:hypothetical protein
LASASSARGDERAGRGRLELAAACVMDDWVLTGLTRMLGGMTTCFWCGMVWRGVVRCVLVHCHIDSLSRFSNSVAMPSAPTPGMTTMGNTHQRACSVHAGSPVAVLTVHVPICQRHACSMHAPKQPVLPDYYPYIPGRRCLTTSLCAFPCPCACLWHTLHACMLWVHMPLLSFPMQAEADAVRSGSLSH